MRHGFIRRGAVRRIIGPALATALLAFTAWILEVLQPSLVTHISSYVDGADILQQHSDILRAVRRRQPAAAERAMRAHIEHLLGVLHDVDEGTAKPR